MNGTHRLSRRGMYGVALALGIPLAMGGVAGAQVAPVAATPAPGIWKAVVPPHPIEAEFGGLDPVGLAAGARIQADCSLNWIDPDDGHRYCFASGTSLLFFLDSPRSSLARARRQWSLGLPAH